MNQREHINRWLKLTPSGFDPNVETHRETERGLEYGSWKQYEGQVIDERNIAPNEVVIDIDTETTEKARQEFNKVVTYLETNGLPFNIFDTGGTSFHAHIFFEVPEDKSWKELRPYRLALYKWIKSECKEKVGAETDLWDDGVVDFDLSIGSGHLIRAIGGRKNSTEHRKTLVSKSQLEKKQVKDFEEVEFPLLDNKTDYWRMSKLEGSEADLTWSEIQDKAKEIREEEEERRKKQLETEFKSEGDGLQAVREVPASEVLKLIGRDHKPGDQITCPVHDDSNPSAHITDGSESAQMPENRLVCYANSCTQDSETETPFKMYNSIDILVDGADFSFEEAVEELSEEFDIKVELEDEEDKKSIDDYQSSDFYKNESWDYSKLADVIETFENFKYISEDDTDQLFIQEDDVWKEKGESKITEYCMELTDEKLYSSRAIKNVKDIIKNRNRIYKEDNFFQPPEKLVPFNNGVYDVEKEEFREYQEEDNFLFKHPVNYVENLEEKEDKHKVEEFIDTIQDTQRKKQILKECTALAMLPSYPIQKAPILFGDGGNGKGVFVDMVKRMTANYHEMNLSDYTEDKFAAAELKDKVFVFFDEFQHISDVSKVKQFIGSEESRSRDMQQLGEMTKRITFPIFAGNELPNPPERRPSFWRRWEIIDFPFRFTEKDDQHKDMKSKAYLENNYWTQEALDCYATKAVHTLKDTIERQGFTNGQSVKEVEHMWDQRATPVYSFLTHFVEQGELPNQGTTTKADFIRKDILLEMANHYIEELNGGNVQTYELTQAIERSADLERGNDQQVSLGNSGTTMAYSGLKLTLPSFDDINQTNDLQSSVIRNLLVEYWEHFSDVNSKQGAQIVEIVKTELYGKVLNYLDLCENDQASLLEIIKALDLSEEEIPEVTKCDYIKVVEPDGSGKQFQILKFDRETFKQAVKEHGSMVMESGDLKPVSRWVNQKISDLAKNQHVLVDDYFIEPGVEKGYSEDKIEETVEENLDQGDLFSPEPGKVAILS